MVRARKYERISNDDDGSRFDFEARISTELPQARRADSFDDIDDGAHDQHSGRSSPTLLEKGSAKGDEDDDDLSEDELMAQDPLHKPTRAADRGDRRVLRKARKQARKVARKLRGRKGLKHALFGVAFLAVLAGLACFIIGFVKHHNSNSSAAPAGAIDKQQAHPALPEGVNPKPIMPVPVNAPASTEHDSAVPDLSPEAVAQAQGVNGDIQEATASTVAAAAAAQAVAVEAAAEAEVQLAEEVVETERKHGFAAAVESITEQMEDIWAWFDAKWDDVFNNSGASGAPVY